MAVLLTSGLIPSLRPNSKFSRLSTVAKPPSFLPHISTRHRKVFGSTTVSVLHTANGSASSNLVYSDVEVEDEDEEEEEEVEDAEGGKYIRQDYLVKKVSAKDVQALLKEKRSVPLVLDFYATWCGPCILMAQELEMLAVEYESNALFVKVDTDDEYEFARDMQVRGLPTLYFFSPDPSKDAIRTEGLVPPELIKNIIDSEL